MDATGLPARIGYAAIALPVGGAAGFRVSMWLLPQMSAHLYGAETDVDGYVVFRAAVSIGAGLAFTAALLALTLPWKRRRRRTGRARRMVVSSVFVVLASLALAGQGYALVYDLAFAGWLAYTIAYTYVRYGIVDRAHGIHRGSHDSIADDYLR